MEKIIFCLAEDRKGAEPGIKLAILSLHKHCPGAPIVLYRPSPLPEFADWLRRFPGVALRDAWPANLKGWDCKPAVLLDLLGQSPPDHVVWLDSDILVSRDPRPRLLSPPPESLVISGGAAHQPQSGTALRTRGWNLPVGRAYPDTFYSCVIRVTAHHRKLLERWQALLSDHQYLEARKLPFDRQPPHLMSDQDVLNALIGSREFESLAVDMLVHGRDILHTGGAAGFSLSERLRGMFASPPLFLHAIGSKPWVLLHPDWQGRELGFRHRRLQQELSEYVSQARGYRDGLDEPCEWMDFISWEGALFRALGLGHWALRGLPITLAATLVLQGRALIRR